MKIRTLYIACAITPYKSKHPVFGFLGNIQRGQRMAVEALLAGFYPFCPFLDYQYWGQLRAGENITEKMIKGLSMVFLELCDAVLVLPKYRKSQGTLDEIARAKELDMPVFYSLEDIIDHEEENNENKTT